MFKVSLNQQSEGLLEEVELKLFRDFSMKKLKVYLSTYTEHAKQITVTAMDVVYTLKKVRKNSYDFGS